MGNVAGLQPAWTVNAPGPFPTSPVVYANLAYVSQGQYLRAINVVDGATAWTVDEGLDSQGHPMRAAAPTVVADGVWSGSAGVGGVCPRGGIVRYDRTTGAVRSQVTGVFDNCDPPVALGDGIAEGRTRSSRTSGASTSDRCIRRSTASSRSTRPERLGSSRHVRSDRSRPAADTSDPATATCTRSRLRDAARRLVISVASVYVSRDDGTVTAYRL